MTRFMKYTSLLSSIIFLWVASFLSTTQAQITLVPDTLFEAELIQRGYDTDMTINGQVSTSQLALVVNLFINSRGIADMTGIEDCINMVHLDVANNNLTSLDLSNLTNLETVTAADNQLTSISVANCSSLKHLYCGGNQLSVLNVSNLTSLESISVSHNQLTSLLVTGCTSLRGIVCGYNPTLTTLDISTNPNLNTLAARWTNVQQWDFTNNPNISTLSLEGIGLTSVDLSPLVNVNSITIYDNNLTVLDVSTCVRLSRLNVRNNQLSSLDLSNNPSMYYLSADNNSLVHLDLVNNNVLRDIYVDSNRLTTLDLSNKPGLRVVRAHQNLLTYVNAKNPVLYDNSIVTLVSLQNNLPNLTICVIDSAYVRNNPSIWTADSTVLLTEICTNTTLLGHVRADDNSNCIAETNEWGLSRHSLTINNGIDTTYTYSNTNGFYTGELLPDVYQIDIKAAMPYRLPCLANQSVTIDSLNDLDTINWSVYTTAYCPYMQVSMSAPFLRATGGGSDYVVNYCNLGTEDAYGAYVEVTIDSALRVTQTSLPILSQNGNVYTFDLDTVRMNGCHSFTIGVIADSTATSHQVFCSEAHIYPDSLCVNTWNGPIIQANGTCQNDTVVFELSNVGSNMNVAQTYTIFEDHVMLFTAPFTLGASGTITIRQPANPGKTYRIEALQANGIPAYVASPIAHNTIFNCVTSPVGAWNNSITNQFYNGNTTPWIHQDCQGIIGAYDPNDKAAQPVGYGSDHYINRGIPLTYKVRFQNTGNDTAFNIVIVDTLSAALDITTLQVTGGSHLYTWTISPQGVLQLVFADVKLVDSLTNEPLSHGFFTYEIQQKANLPIGTRIENTAAIYFDYNPPIFTNTTFHTIGENFFTLLSVDDVWLPKTEIKAYPNPFSRQTTIEVVGQDFEELTLEVVDVAGRVVEHVRTEQTNQVVLFRKNLLPGIYFYRLVGDGQAIGAGKLHIR